MKYRRAFFLIATWWSLQAHSVEVTGHLPDLRFDLTDDRGHEMTQQDARGKVVLLYFGFSGCSAQCPLTLQQVTATLYQLGVQADDVRMLFVTIDPAHDTPEILQHYVRHFDGTHIIGLTGNPADLQTLAKQYRAIYPLGAEPVHSNAIYLFDRQGHVRALLDPQDTALLPTIRQLLGEAP